MPGSANWKAACGDLEGKIGGFCFAALADDEEFLSAVLNATQTAMRTHHVRKKEALRNAVLNVAAGRFRGSERDPAFWALIDRFTPLHLEILSFFHSPWDAIDRSGKRIEQKRFAQPVYLVLLDVIDGLDERVAVSNDRPGAMNQIFQLVIQDLSAAGLIGIDTHLATPPKWERWTTHLGDYFLEFIRAPIGSSCIR